MIQNTFAALISICQEGLITELNLVAERLTGISREEALCRLSEEIVHLGENIRAFGPSVAGRLIIMFCYWCGLRGSGRGTLKRIG